ncbi:MAG TPA: hypothetical protein PLF37_10150, partial [Planctomycetota bacterium]|nr:hypothetical protein [Planctomycetota bacterium]
MIRASLLMFLFAVVATTLGAQTTVTLGTYSSGNQFPFNTFGYSPSSMRYQTSYGASEINLTSGAQLIEVRVPMTSVPATMPTWNNFRLRIAHSTLAVTALTTSYDTNYTGTLTTCIGPVNYQPATIVVGSQTYARYPCTTSFAYNGTQALLVDWSFDSVATTGWTVNGSGRSRVYGVGTTYASTTGGGTDQSGNWQIQLIFQLGPGITVTATPGTAQNVYANSTGTGSNGISAGTFTLATNSLGAATLNSINITAQGTGND